MCLSELPTQGWNFRPVRETFSQEPFAENNTEVPRGVGVGVYRQVCSGIPLVVEL